MGQGKCDTRKDHQRREEDQDWDSEKRHHPPVLQRPVIDRAERPILRL